LFAVNNPNLRNPIQIKCPGPESNRHGRGHALQSSSVRSGILFSAGSGPDEDPIIKGIGLGRWPWERGFAAKG